MVKRKDGLWQQQMTVVVNGVKKQKFFYGKTKAEVLRKIANFTEEAKRGAYFQFVADEWWAQHEPTLARRTLTSYEPALNRAIEHFGNKPIQSITPPEISTFIKSFSKTHADKTTRTQLMIFNLIFKYAVEKGYVEINPVRDLEVPKDLPKRKLQHHPRKIFNA